VKVNVERVDDAGARKPLRKARVVEVAFSPVPRVVNGKLKELPQPVHDETTKLPIVAKFALKFVVDAKEETKRLVVVAFCESRVATVPDADTNDWRVVDPSAKNSPVVVAPPKMVRPVPVVPAPIVDEAREYRPDLNPMRVEVELCVPQSVPVVNGNVNPGVEERVPAESVRLAPMVRGTIEPLPCA